MISSLHLAHLKAFNGSRAVWAVDASGRRKDIIVDGAAACTAAAARIALSGVLFGTASELRHELAAWLLQAARERADAIPRGSIEPGAVWRSAIADSRSMSDGGKYSRDYLCCATGRELAAVTPYVLLAMGRALGAARDAIEAAGRAILAALRGEPARATLRLERLPADLADLPEDGLLAGLAISDLRNLAAWPSLAASLGQIPKITAKQLLRLCTDPLVPAVLAREWNDRPAGSLAMVDLREAEDLRARGLLAGYAGAICEPDADLLSAREPLGLCLYVPSQAIYHSMVDTMARGVEAFAPRRSDAWPCSLPSQDWNGRLELRIGEVNPWELDPIERGQCFASMWDLVERSGDTEADVFTYLTAKWLQRAKHPTDVVEIGIAELLGALGYQRNTGGQGRRGGYKQWGEIVRALAYVRRLHVSVVTPPAGKKSRKRVVMETPLFAWGGRLSQMSLTGATLPSDVLAERFQATEEWGRFLLEERRFGLEALLSTVLRIPKKKTVEKRLARSLCWYARIEARKGTGCKVLMVRTLLARALQLADGPPPSRWYRLRARLHSALTYLEAPDVGVLSHYRYVTPEGKTWTAWLDARVELEWSPVLQSAADRRALGAVEACRLLAPGAASLPGEVPWTAGEIRTYRRARRVPLAVLAEAAGVCTMAVSRWEKGLDKLTSRQVAAIRQRLAYARIPSPAALATTRGTLSRKVEDS